jgi:flagella basal body P-ring formation protein FlgA
MDAAMNAPHLPPLPPRFLCAFGLAWLALVLSAPAALAAEVAPKEVVRAVARGAGLQRARATLIHYRAPGRCNAERAEVERPITSSGTVSLHIEGTSADGSACRGFARADVRLFAQVWVTTKALQAGEPLAGATELEEREVQPGHPPLGDIAPGLAAIRTLGAGTVLEQTLVFDPSWQPGANVRVVVRAGGLLLAQQGRVLACAQGRACAQLPSGRRVEGRREGSDLVLETP